MNLTEEKCRDSLSNLYYILDGKHCDGCIRDGSEYCVKCKIKEDLSVMRNLIHEHFKDDFSYKEERKEEMQHMANGIILTCHIMMSDTLCKNDFYNRRVVLIIFSETGITKDEFKNCDDEISKNTIIELFNNEETFYREMGWI